MSMFGNSIVPTAISTVHVIHTAKIMHEMKLLTTLGKKKKYNRAHNKKYCIPQCNASTIDLPFSTSIFDHLTAKNVKFEFFRQIQI